MRGSLAIMLALLLTQVPTGANAACPIVNLLTGDIRFGRSDHRA